jgi:hypothetical protein
MYRLSGEVGLLVDEAPDSLFSSDVVAAGHLAQPGRSTITKHVGVSDVLYLVALKTSYVPSSGRWSASRLLFRRSATRTTGRILQRLGCNFPLFRGCLCKIWDVNYRKYM